MLVLNPFPTLNDPITIKIKYCVTDNTYQILLFPLSLYNNKDVVAFEMVLPEQYDRSCEYLWL